MPYDLLAHVISAELGPHVDFAPGSKAEEAPRAGIARSGSIKMGAHWCILRGVDDLVALSILFHGKSTFSNVFNCFCTFLCIKLLFAPKIVSNRL